ncbi:MAG TPA: cysteine dioxygenase family protein [Thermoanaerobaculia bacterium]|nr:cysteine dioxygenase family protein [Thermoanaerobaculia bacterium]
MDLHHQSHGSGTVQTPLRVPISEFAAGLETISTGLITKQGLYDYLTTYEIEPDDLKRLEHWEPDRHTRNLILRNPKLELMLICWNVGNTTPLHTHNGQLGWMVMGEGKLQVENFRLRACNKPENQEVVGIDCLAGATEIDMEPLDIEICRPGGPLNTVDKHHTIHRITNLKEWNEPAVSLHVYSLPIDSCVVFDLEAQRCFRRDLTYDYEAPGARRA